MHSRGIELVVLTSLLPLTMAILKSQHCRYLIIQLSVDILGKLQYHCVVAINEGLT